MSINLTPLTDINLVNENHTVTATITDGSGNPVPGIDVTFSITSGPNTGDTGTDTTDANGEATFTYTGDGGVGTDVIVACYTNDVDQKICSQTVNKVWNPPQIDYKITLSPDYALNLVGQQHTVTATVTEVGSGTPQSGVEVTFTIISGPNTSSIGTATTDANGEASIFYTGNGGVGTDNIQACFTREEETICSNVVKKEWTEEAISLSPLLAQNNLGEEHTVTATIQTLKGAPVAGVVVQFKIKSGPNSSLPTSSDTTDANGEATYSYTGNTVGTDVIQACFTNAAGQEVCTDTPGRVGSDAIKEWGNPCPTITVSPDQLTNAVTGQDYSQQFTTSSGTSPFTFAQTSGTLPPGLTLTGDTLSGTPTSVGVYTFTITATDANGCPGSRQYNLSVGSSGSCPTITVGPSQLTNAVKDQVYSQQFTASGGTSPYTFAQTSGALPPGLTLTGDTLSGTPTSTGIYTFTITATDANGCPGSTQYDLSVSSSGTCPTITVSPSQLTNDAVKDRAYSQQFTASGGTSPYTFTQTSGTLPPGLTLTGDTLSGTPTSTGIYTFTITATDANGCPGSTQYDLSVTGGICPAIEPNPDQLTNAVEGVPYGPQQFTGFGGTEPYTFDSADLPIWLDLTTAGVLSGTPTTEGQYTFSITVTDKNGCTGSRQYTLYVGPGGVCPAIMLSPDNLTNAVKDQPYSQQITASGGTSPYSFAITSGNLPPGMSLSSTGLLSGTPTLLGLYTFTVGVTDNVGCPGELQYTLRVSTSSSCPTITVSPSNLTNAVIGVFYSRQFTASGGTSRYTFALTGGSLPTGVTLSSNGLLSGTPTTEGPYTFTITATDNEGCPGSSQLALEVCPGGYLIPESDNLSDGIVGRGYSQTITSSVGAATFVRTGDLPPGLIGTATANSYVISGTPTTKGTWTIRIAATTSGDCPYSRFYSIRIGAAPTPTPVPTLSEWGMILTALSLCLAGYVFLRRRKV